MNGIRFGDFTTQSSTAEGVYYDNGTLQTSKLKMLSRTYAQVCVERTERREGGREGERERERERWGWGRREGGGR